MANETSTLQVDPESINDECTYSHSHNHSTEVRTNTIASAGTETPKNRLKNKVIQTPPTHQMVTTPMSTCSGRTTTTTTSDGTYSNRSSSDGSGTLYTSSSRQSSCSSIRVPVPSPTRSRLDRQYAKRLAASSMYHLHTPTAKSPTATTMNTPATVATTTTTTTTATSTPNTSFSTTSSSSSPSSSSSKIMPPPGIARDYDSSNFFRPTPIITSTESPNTEHMHRTPSRFFFPSTPQQQYEESSRNNASSMNSNSSSISSSRRRRNSSIINSMDMGISDRFIPSRATSNMNINLWDSMNGSSRSSRRNSSQGGESGDSGGSGSNGAGDSRMNNNNNTATGSDDTNNTAGGGGGSVNPATGRVNETYSTTQQNLHNVLLRSELLGENMSPYSTASQIHSASRLAGGTSAPLGDGMNRLRFQSPRQDYHNNLYADSMGPASVVNSFSLTPFGTASSQQLMATPQKHRRKIAKVPFKVLDAPALQDDFYLNLVDWSSQNVLAVGLGSCVYLWSACTSKVTKLCDLAQAEDIVTSVSWAQRGTHLAVGTNKGEVQLWDTIKVKKVRTMAGHTARVGTLAWSGPTLASGSRDRLIFLRDVRAKSAFTDRLNNHRQEVCGLRWSYDEPAFLASGGNDNQLHVVDSRNPVQPVHRFTDHTAAVKAIAWSPHQHGLLASGGGTADRCIRFWNTLSGSALNCVDTGSQVCNLAWSQNCNEIVSTHGYSLNQIVVWRYPSLSKVVTLTGHTYRVLYLAMSPDGSTIVTGAGDETLRFWQVFPGPRSDAKNNAGGLLFPNTLGSVIR
jgi:cell division cycle 20-like protein 1 (cofactor of APC complex)